MFANLFTTIVEDPSALLHNPVLLLMTAFQIWMLIDAIRREEWMWAVCIFFFWVFSAFMYYMYVYRASMPLNSPTFEMPGAGIRRRIKHLQDQIHHLDKAHHHSQLADVYFSQGKLKEAEAEYLLALERDGEDMETRAHYGQCLLRLKRPQEALPILEKVCAENPRHEYGQTKMMYAETLGALGRKDEAIQTWREVLEHHTYAQAQVSLAELLIEKGEKETARQALQQVIADAGHGPAFQRKREKGWVKKARSLLRSAQ